MPLFYAKIESGISLQLPVKIVIQLFKLRGGPEPIDRNSAPTGKICEMEAHYEVKRGDFTREHNDGG